MSTVAIIQARTGSTRLPSKVLMDINGKPTLRWVIERTKRAALVDEVIVATTDREPDDAVALIAEDCGVQSWRGPSSDVLLRYVQAANATNADVVIRITADCPLIDSDVIDMVVAELGNADYCSNVVRRSYPRGLDVEAFHRDVLMRVARMAFSPQAREHVTLYIYEEHPELFRIRHVIDGVDNSDLNFCLDTEADLHYLRRIAVDAPYRQLVAKARNSSLAAPHRL